jgi:TRAP-type C4-dicarboxylate transport system permease large subunit
VNFVLVAVPLFLLMGEILLRSGLSDRLYRALNLWFGGLPGGLLHTNIIACAVFSAIAGSSVATAATIGSVALLLRDSGDLKKSRGQMSIGALPFD